MLESTSKVATPEEYSLVLPGTVTVSSNGLGWRGLVIQRFKQLAAGSVDFPACSHHTLAYFMSGCADFAGRFADQRYRTEMRARSFMVSPAQADECSSWRNGFEAAVHYVDPSLTDRVAVEVFEVDPRKGDLHFTIGSSDHQVDRLMTLLLEEASSGGQLGRLYADSLALALSVALVRNYSGISRPRQVHKGGLRPGLLERVLEYMRANIAANVSLEDLAKITGLSQFHLIRQFKSSVGVTPCQYMIEARVQRAKQLLADDNRTLADIALTLGYKDQSHFGRIFRKTIGITPGEWRRHI